MSDRKRLLTVTYDVTGWEEEEVSSLALEAYVQAERSDGHPTTTATVADPYWTQACRDCGAPFPYAPDADRCPGCILAGCGELLAACEWYSSHPETAVKPGPGKFEACEDARIADCLYVMAGESWLDEQWGDVDEPMGWNGRVGRYLVTEDDRGFFWYVDYLDAATAARIAAEEQGLV